MSTACQRKVGLRRTPAPVICFFMPPMLVERQAAVVTDLQKSVWHSLDRINRIDRISTARSAGLSPFC
jgi:hypothetical protein